MVNRKIFNKEKSQKQAVVQWGYDWTTNHLDDNAWKGVGGHKHRAHSDHLPSHLWFGNKSRTWKTICQSERDMFRSHNGMLSFDFRNRNRWVRVKNYWLKNTRKKDKSKHNTGEVKSGRKQVDPGTYFFCIQRTRRNSISPLPRAVQNCLPPCVIDHQSPKLFLRPSLLCSPLYKSLDIAHYFSHVEKSGIQFIMVQKRIKRENL